MLDRIYYGIVRKLITSKDERNKYSGGLWPRLVREKAAEQASGLTGNIADLGCGEGLFLQKLAENNPAARVSGIEHWREILQAAGTSTASLPNVSLIEADILATGISNASFDRAYCLNTVLNLPTFDVVRQLFKEVHRILKPSGIFVFDVRNALNPMIRLQYRFVKYYDPGIQTPTNAYQTKQIVALLQETGYTLKKKQYLDILPAHPFSPVILFTAEKR
jgi:ubiquinone/menaquinone biosynthesis C-methylase UbiE